MSSVNGACASSSRAQGGGAVAVAEVGPIKTRLTQWTRLRIQMLRLEAGRWGLRVRSGLQTPQQAGHSSSSARIPPQAQSCGRTIPRWSQVLRI